jgi:arginine utilization protein RocB
MTDCRPDPARAEALALAFTGWPSVTGSAGEAEFPKALRQTLAALPYFQANPSDLWLDPLPGDPQGRSNLFALVRGEGARTVLLSGHFDVVAAQDYGDLASLAFHPALLTAPLIERLERSGENPLALADLRSGAFLPGRGLLDMKAGLAAGAALLEAFAASPQRRGNLLLVATPDEENQSAGMRAAADRLPEILAERGLQAVLGINLDATQDTGDGSKGRVVALGGVGKLLLSALVVGKEAHASYPQNGVNAAYLAAAIAERVEFAPELAESGAAPPTLLGQRDLKAAYDVTTPARVWLIWNLLRHDRRGADLLAAASGLVRAAAREAAERLRARLGPAATQLTPSWTDIPVLSFAEVKGRAAAADPGFEAAHAALARELALRADLDSPGRSRLLTEHAFGASRLEGPVVILGFAAMPYPATPAPGAAIEALVAAAAGRIAARFGTTVELVRRWPVISDMSFLGPADGDDLREVAAATPIWGSAIAWDLARTPTPGVPMVNLGPWGRDYHHWLERVHAPYAFEVLPALLAEIATSALADPEPTR